MVQPMWKTTGWALIKLNIPFPYNPAVTILGARYSWKLMPTWQPARGCSQQLFLIVNTWTQPRCSSLSEWINCGTCKSGISFSAKNNLKCMSLNEKKPIWMTPTIWHMEKAKLWRQEKRQWLSGASGQGGTSQQSTEGFGGSEAILSDAVLVAARHYTFVKTQRMYNSESAPQCKLWAFGDNAVSMSIHQLWQMYHFGREYW